MLLCLEFEVFQKDSVNVMATLASAFLSKGRGDAFTADAYDTADEHPL